jgi:F-type H+-transporting ATPase subunit c
MKFLKPIAITLAMLILLMTAGIFVGSSHLMAAGPEQGQQVETEASAEAGEEAAGKKATVSSDMTTVGKAIGAALAIGLAAIGGTFAMGNAIAKSADGVARQPEASDNIRTMLMLGLVFIETVVIYALIVAILIVFVM